MIYAPEIETRLTEEQFRIDSAQYLRQVETLFERSGFYRRKLHDAGIRNAAAAGALSDLHRLPFTEKDELRRTQVEHPPFGEHLACDPADLVRVYSTSGTTGMPCFIGLTRNDLDMYATNVARGYTAAGFTPGQRIAVGVNAGPFVAGAIYAGFDRIGCTTIPAGTGNTERMVAAMRALHATGIACTPSFGLYLADWCHERGIDTRGLRLRNMVTAGEPGGGDPQIRVRLEQAFGCQVRECMGVGDISLTVWGEDADGNGMNFMAREFVHVELIDPATGRPIPWEDDAHGELVYTALKREAMPLLRFRSRDHVVVNLQPNPTGRTGPRIRCIGRTDDMLIVRGVNLFPSALRGVLRDFAPDVGEMFQIQPRARGVAQSPPLPVVVELARNVAREPEGMRQRMNAAIRARLLVTAEVELVPYGTLPRGEYKTQLVDYSRAGEPGH
ncbi:MAG: AMP-binding protein [Gammaproteobacteria bacterium]|nr:AMP-binding protein [Gammaproteobacteria bacterium]